MMRLLNSKYLNSLHKSNDSFKLFTESKSRQLTLLNPVVQTYLKKVQVSYRSPKVSDVVDLFGEEDWSQYNIILPVDPVPLLGMNRTFFFQYMQESIYENIEKPGQFMQGNPDSCLSLDQLKFHDEIYFLMDKDVKIPDKGLPKNQHQMNQFFNTQVQTLYSEDSRRNKDRLLNQLRVPKQYLSIFEEAMNQECNIYFAGINQYTLRKIITLAISIQEIKSLFLNCLKHSIKASRDQKHFNYFAKEYLYLRYYNIIQVFEIKQIKTLLKFLEQDPEASKMRSVLFAHSYTFDSLNNLEDCDVKEPVYNQRDKTTKTKQEDSEANPEKQLQTDLIKIEKNAILQTMLGGLWDQVYSRNKFPYLSEDFKKLSFDDQKEVEEIYRRNLARYSLAKQNFYKSNL